MGKRIIIRLSGILCLFMLMGSVSHAEVTGDEAFSALNWEFLYEDQMFGSVQSICATEDYIITIDNVSDNPEDPDIVSAYYKNDTNEYGQSVQKYGLAKRVINRCWEHGNGMAYNPNTHEIYVALYTNAIPENRGCIYVMNPDTLEYKRTIKVSDDYNLLGIAYKEDTNQYVIQTNAEGGYSFKILDENFQLAEDLGEYAETSKGPNFQDMAVDGDYIMNFPLTLNMGIGEYLNVYSISRKALVAMPQIEFGMENIKACEPESLCQIEPGVYLAAINVVEADGMKKNRFYRLELPYYLYVNVTGDTGETVTQRVLRGESFEVDCTPAEGYELTRLMVNGKDIPEEERKELGSGYLLQDIREDQNIEIGFEKLKEAVPLEESSEDTRFETKSIFPVERTIGMVCAGIIMLVMYLYYSHVRMERKRKQLRVRKQRRRYAARV